MLIDNSNYLKYNLQTRSLCTTTLKKKKNTSLHTLLMILISYLILKPILFFETIPCATLYYYLYNPRIPVELMHRSEHFIGPVLRI